MLDLHGEFTVNIPVGDVNTAVLRFCGCESGRDTDKISEMGLTLEEGECVQVPGIREFPLTLECKVIYKQKQDLHEVPKSILNRFYSEQDTGNYHIAYYGEILNAYKII